MVRLTEQAEGLADTLHGDRRVILHAVYFEAKTIAQGRKVPAALACANPILKDVAEVLTMLRIPWQFEVRAWDAPAAALPREGLTRRPGRALRRARLPQDKSYSRNPTVERGRLRVVLRNDEDMPHNPDVPDRARPQPRSLARVTQPDEPHLARRQGAVQGGEQAAAGAPGAQEARSRDCFKGLGAGARSSRRAASAAAASCCGGWGGGRLVEEEQQKGQEVAQTMRCLRQTVVAQKANAKATPAAGGCAQKGGVRSGGSSACMP